MKCIELACLQGDVDAALRNIRFPKRPLGFAEIVALHDILAAAREAVKEHPGTCLICSNKKA
jgi:hypothetical protein